MMSRAFDAQKMNSQYTRTGATKIIPPSSLDSPFPIIVQLYYNKLVVCYLCFMTSSILVRLRHHVVKQMSFEAILLFSASVFNISLGTWQTLMHEKQCLNPILCLVCLDDITLTLIWNFSCCGNSLPCSANFWKTKDVANWNFRFSQNT